MGFLSDNFDFEKFHLSDMWDRLKDDPKRLILGVDPFSTTLWNGILGRDDEPIMNQLGGPMGSGWTGMGSGGVYDRAEAAGVDTGAAIKMHDIAETVAGIWGAAAAGGAIGGIGGGAGGTGGASGGSATGGGVAGGGGGASSSFVGPPEAASGGGGGGFWSDWSNPFGGEGGGFGNMDWSDPNSYMGMMQNMGGMGGGQEQQQPQGPRPMRMTQSSFDPVMPQQQQPFMPGRSTPFGLLMEDDEEARMKAMLGGLL
ncbi:MAG: hypothetical protein ACTSWM_00165 [Alphaproteobacteria bacterium]